LEFAVNPDLSDAIAASWSFPLWATLSLLLTAVVYWRGWRVARLTRPAELPGWRAASFFAGLAAIWLAIASPLDVLGDWLLLAHMAQHLVLMSVAPPLLLLGAPTVPLLGARRAWTALFIAHSSCDRAHPYTSGDRLDCDERRVYRLACSAGV
jgi:cytochrome c oxidase assembly factor CtaG